MDRQPHPQRKYEPPSTWYVYIVRCSDSSYYTGITTDLSRRLSEHNSVHGGARYTRPRRPVTLVYHETANSRSAASRREYQIKQLTVHGKNSLVRQKKS
jgi:putative endonuclease